MFAKNSILVGLALSGLAAGGALAEGQPRGTLIELHSCEVYAGGCVVSSEAASGGHYLLQVWDLTGGAWHGVDLGGLRVAVLEASTENLAAPTAQAEQAVVYLPETASAQQRQALLAWIESRLPRLQGSALRTRVVPISFVAVGNSMTFTAGKFASLKADSVGACESRVCGEALWYAPRTPTLLFTVALNAGSQVNEPWLELKWSDHAKRSVFVAHFDESRPAKQLFVSSSDWCGSSGRLF